MEDIDDSNVDDDILHMAFKVQIIKNLIDIPVHAHLEYAKAYKNLQIFYGIADSGANSIVLSKNAYVLHETVRYATLIGYNPKHTRSKHIQIFFCLFEGSSP